MLEWSRIEHVIAAEVGEPQGVCTIVFDLVLEADDEDWVVCRFDADPSEDAMEIARAIAGALPADRVGGSIKSLATGSRAAGTRTSRASRRPTAGPSREPAAMDRAR